MVEDRIAIYVPGLDELLTAAKTAISERPRRLTIKLKNFEHVLFELIREIGQDRELISVRFGKTIRLSERQAYSLKTAIINAACQCTSGALEAAAFRRAFLDAGLRAPEHIFPVHAQKVSSQHVQWWYGNQLDAEATVQKNQRPVTAISTQFRTAVVV